MVCACYWLVVNAGYWLFALAEMLILVSGTCLPLARGRACAWLGEVLTLG
jgi:hypothetical protein